MLLTLSGPDVRGRDDAMALFAPEGDPLASWETQRFEGETLYRPVAGPDGPVVEARALGAASGRVRELELDPERWRYLAWSWSVDAPVPVEDVRAREGDDFAARVYVVFSGGWARWRTTSLVYVWAPDHAPLDPWPNPFTSQAMMMAATRGPATRDGQGRGGWVEVERDLVADYRAAFGREPPEIIAVAIMTDTDQTGAQARARYAGLRLATGSARAQPAFQ